MAEDPAAAAREPEVCLLVVLLFFFVNVFLSFFLYHFAEGQEDGHDLWRSAL